jgi:hypothetical protein
VPKVRYAVRLIASGLVEALAMALWPTTIPRSRRSSACTRRAPDGLRGWPADMIPGWGDLGHPSQPNLLDRWPSRHRAGNGRDYCRWCGRVWIPMRSINAPKAPQNATTSWGLSVAGGSS